MNGGGLGTSGVSAMGHVQRPKVPSGWQVWTPDGPPAHGHEATAPGTHDATSAPRRSQPVTTPSIANTTQALIGHTRPAERPFAQSHTAGEGAASATAGRSRVALRHAVRPRGRSGVRETRPPGETDGSARQYHRTVVPTECARCVADRRAARSQVAVRASAIAALPAFVAFVLAILVDQHELWPMNQRGVYSLALLAVALACASLVFSALVRRFNRRAAVPLLAPPADPLATYREGRPTECPRHPWEAAHDPPDAPVTRPEVYWPEEELEPLEPPITSGQRAARAFSLTVMGTLLLLAATCLAIPTLD